MNREFSKVFLKEHLLYSLVCTFREIPASRARRIAYEEREK